MNILLDRCCVAHLVLVDHVVLPDVLVVGNRHVARHIADLPNRDRGEVSNLDQLGRSLLPRGHVCGSAPPVVPGGGLVVEDVGLVVGEVVARVVVVGLRVSCSSGAAVAEGGCLGWDGLSLSHSQG